MKKIDADVADYLILSVCNSEIAHEAMRIEPRVRAALPCNMTIRIDPTASMPTIGNAALKAVAGNVRGMLENALVQI
jgi:uncharacterized protein (DUF302 family)